MTLPPQPNFDQEFPLYPRYNVLEHYDIIMIQNELILSPKKYIRNLANTAGIKYEVKPHWESFMFPDGTCLGPGDTILLHNRTYAIKRCCKIEQSVHFDGAFIN